MESRAKIAGHPIHPMLIVFPLGLFISAVVFDILYLVNGNELFSTVAYYNILFGIIMGLVAAIFGFIDWLAIPAGTRAKAIGATHGLGNVLVTALMAGSWFLRMNGEDFVPGTLGYILSFAAIGLGTLTAWLGGELVYRLNVGVDHGANVNAPSSLSGQPAADVSTGMASPVPVTGEEKYAEKHFDKHTPTDPPSMSGADLGVPDDPDRDRRQDLE